MYQLEVKKWPVAYCFPAAEGWGITVDIDAIQQYASPPALSREPQIAEEVSPVGLRMKIRRTPHITVLASTHLDRAREPGAF